MQEVLSQTMSFARIRDRLLAAFDEPQAGVLAEVIAAAYQDLVKTGDFNELKAIVRDLAVAQRRTEQRLEELAAAQQRTEQRLEELAAAQQRTERRLEELAAAQQRTERRLEELAAAQQRTERRLEELAVAQQKTEAALQQLIQDHQETRRQLGGLSATVGYRLEDEAFKALPRLLERDFGLIVQGRLKRGYVPDVEGRLLEVNIFGQAVRNDGATPTGRVVTIVGEGKSQLSANDVDRFIRRKLARLQGAFDELFPLLVTYMITAPDVEEYARQKGIAVYYSYDF